MAAAILLFSLTEEAPFRDGIREPRTGPVALGCDEISVLALRVARRVSLKFERVLLCTCLLEITSGGTDTRWNWVITGTLSRDATR